MVDTSDIGTDIFNRTPTADTMVDCHRNQNAAMFFCVLFPVVLIC